MKKTVFEIKHEQVEIGYVKHGADYDFGDISGMNVHNKTDYYPEIIASFDNQADALKELENYKSDAWTSGGTLGNLLLAEEYWIEEIVYDVDEDGEMEQDHSEGVVEIAPMLCRYDIANREAEYNADMEGYTATVEINRKNYKIDVQVPLDSPDSWVWVDDVENPNLEKLWHITQEDVGTILEDIIEVGKNCKENNA